MAKLNERICNECKIPMDWIKDGSEFKDSEELKPSKMEQFTSYKYDKEKDFITFSAQNVV